MLARGVIASSRRRGGGGGTPPPGGVAYRASATGNSGQTATGTSVPIIIPATAVAGDVASVVLVSTGGTATVTTPTGWTLVSGPDRSGTNVSAWLYEKTIASGEPGSTVTFTLSTTVWTNAVMDVFFGATLTGRLFGALIETTSNAFATLPTVASVPAGSAVSGLYARRSAASTTPDVTPPANYKGTVRAASANTGTNNVSTEGSYQIATTAGSYGGETATVNQNSLGINYLIVFPPAP